ncbi:MAG: SRPBCC domain-containing protein [Kaiparowitsia implicata GSE-PSE-MK54-09C]|jgi:uncharacterized protein YndB with AHSA1/START domain|nr:SRPBCC domain-containing protein [Kaiparowitsia implicata GSE-PSE-MK54-09C]
MTHATPSDLGDRADRTLVITRVFNAPRDLVWQVWTDPNHIAQWWGPRGFTTRVDEMDLRPGGQSRYVMIGPDGTEYPAKGVFKEVVPPERIVSTDEFGEGYDTLIDADLPQGMVMTTLFEDLGHQTKLTLEILHPTVEDRRKHEAMGVVAGWHSSLDCMTEHLERLGAQPGHGLGMSLVGDRDLILTRSFRAPRPQVWNAWTQPQHVQRWFGCGDMPMTECTIDLRVGGTWRYVLQNPSGDMALSGEYLEVTPCDRLVATERYEWVPDSDHINTLTLTECDGTTTLQILVQYAAAAHRDADLQHGMETGLRDTLNRLEALLIETPVLTGNA